MAIEIQGEIVSGTKFTTTLDMTEAEFHKLSFEAQDELIINAGNEIEPVMRKRIEVFSVEPK
ncbi:hypothetical protein [Sporosarcina sp. P17b]|uniref:hypothetical protein n=1 Tax=Sporosarcina sp. P17b TaxID=2048260 RepID=UPI000C167D18|nr:hypothetical protein [Sporosarcina sp. P17b]PIC72399.1 hypothetical protein CSV76_15240 [Sporosarcina sp. P17b]